MASAKNAVGASSGPSDWFTTTHWSVVRAAGCADPAAAQQALEQLCRTYWYPLYAYVRHRGYPREDAQDLTQDFFARLLERKHLAQVHREKGKFRCFALASLKHFLADEWDKATAQKRGGGKVIISLDDSTGEDRFQLEPVDAMDAEKLFERRWALTVLDQARDRLEGEYRTAGKSEVYERIKGFDSGDRASPPYAAVAAELGVTAGALTSAVYRMRQRFRELIRDEVAHTVASPSEIDAEIRHLIRVMSG